MILILLISHAIREDALGLYCTLIPYVDISGTKHFFIDRAYSNWKMAEVSSVSKSTEGGGITFPTCTPAREFQSKAAKAIWDFKGKCQVILLIAVHMRPRRLFDRCLCHFQAYTRGPLRRYLPPRLDRYGPVTGASGDLE